jgi:deoxyribodipyrimidine photo-lyase
LKLAICWFRRDLRLADNPALLAAVEAAESVLPVFLWSPEDEGEWAPGAARRWWLHHSLAAFEEALRARGSRLLLRAGPADEALSALVAETGAEGVYWNRLYDPALVERDAKIKARLRAAGVEARSFKSGLLFEPQELETAQGDPYRVFTPFWKSALRRPEPGAPLPAAAAAAGSGHCARRARTRGTQAPAPDPLGRGPGGSMDAGRERAPRRGSRRGARTGSAIMPRSVTGPTGTGRLLCRLTSTTGRFPRARPGTPLPGSGGHCPRRGSKAGFANSAGASSRTTCCFIFRTRPRSRWSARFAAFPWREDHEALLEAWQRGRTGIPIVDAGMRQLWTTGWMHNRVRMIVASLLVKNIRAPWLAGARWFWDTLVDADLANNTLGWQWSAGSGADAAPYFRIFNPVLQGQKFDPEGTYVRRWVPELAGVPGAALHQPSARLAPGYPAPVIDLKRSREEALAALASLRPARRP